LGPALVHALQRPFRTAARNPDGLTIYDYKDRIRMGGRNDPSSHPTAGVDRNFEFHFSHCAISQQFLRSRQLTIYDNLYRNITAISDAGALDAPIWLLIIRRLM